MSTKSFGSVTFISFANDLNFALKSLVVPSSSSEFPSCRAWTRTVVQSPLRCLTRAEEHEDDDAKETLDILEHRIIEKSEDPDACNMLRSSVYFISMTKVVGSEIMKRKDTQQQK
jgi:hypothetical protein